MRNLYKTALVAVVAVLGFRMAATADAVTAAEVTPAANKAGVFYYSLNDLFVNSLSAQIRTEAQAQELELAEYDAENDLLRQLSQVRNFLTVYRGQALMVNPVDAQNGEAVLRAARKANVPVIFFNRRPSQGALDTYNKAWYVGSNPELSGLYQAQILTDYLENNINWDKNGNGKLDYLLIKGERNHADTQGRSAAFREGMRAAGYELNALDVAYADFSYARAVRYLQNYLAGHDIGEIEAVVCNNDAMALGIIDELQHRGYNEGDGSRYIPVVGIDATEKALNSVKDGSMVGTVYNNAPAVARTVVRLTSLLTRGEEVNVKSLGMPVSGRQVMVPYVKVTLANVGSLRR